MTRRQLIPSPWTETARTMDGRTWLYYENPVSTDFFGVVYGPTEMCKTAEDARRLAVRDMLDSEDIESARQAMESGAVVQQSRLREGAPGRLPGSSQVVSARRV